MEKLSIDGAHRIRKLFLKEDIGVVLSADETFLRFRETSSKVLAPKGIRRVGVTLYVTENDGCSVMIPLDMFANIVLPLVIILTGVFGAKLMEEYKDIIKSTVLFTETHWMTSATNMLYFKCLSNLYPGKKLVLFMTIHLIIIVNILIFM